MQDSKAARIPQNELLDMIYDCFKRYNYWPLKSLKAELNQPEAYLKQTLELVAHLVRQGTHAMTWQLKPESRLRAYADKELYEEVKDEAAPDIEFDGASDHKEFEDILPSEDNEEFIR
jgi:transcription initiation factor TFIIF subunit beta